VSSAASDSPTRFTTISHEEYQALRAGAQVLSFDEHGEKVLRTPDRRIIKLFRRKRLISTALFFPYAMRFSRAAEKLHLLGVAAPQVQAVHFIPSIKRHAVIYAEMPGVNLRTALEDQSQNAQLLMKLAEFMAGLHGKGVYFRAIHFGNVFVCNDGQYRPH
jgi:tRNA A-37 threonylcarbamoyl transferase component Bud32